MSTPILINSGSIFSNANGSITVTLPTAPTLIVNTAALAGNAHANLVNMVIGGGVGPGVQQLKQLSDVVGANSGNDGYILQVDTQGTANTADDTYDFVANNLDGGDF